MSKPTRFEQTTSDLVQAGYFEAWHAKLGIGFPPHVLFWVGPQGGIVQIVGHGDLVELFSTFGVPDKPEDVRYWLQQRAEPHPPNFLPPYDRKPTLQLLRILSDHATHLYINTREEAKPNPRRVRLVKAIVDELVARQG